MPDYGIPVAAYRAALVAEANTPGIPKEQKAAIVAELESLGPRTADEDRAAMESAMLGPVTVGRAPAADVVQDHAPEVASVDAPAVVSPAQTSVASTSRAKSKEPIDASPEVESEDEAVEL